MEETTDKALRQHLVYLLSGGGAHADFDHVVADLTLALVNERVTSLPYTIWHVLEHMRIAQWDILEFSRNARHRSPKFPEGYWPSPRSKADAATLEATLSQFRSDLSAMLQLISDPKTNLFEPISHGNGQTLLREALLVADHNAYHLGALVVIKRIVKDGKGSNGL